MARAVKWCLDRLIALGCLLLLAPVMLLIALLVLLVDGRPALHRELRVGQRGKPFMLLKFRSMTTTEGPGVAPEKDPRITRLGGWLRRWRLDELPQLLNVLTADMSLVGPRPQIPQHVAALAETDASELLSVRPGVTGASALAFIGDDAALAGNSNAEELYLQRVLPAKTAAELEYLHNWSLRTDALLLLRTVIQMWSPAARRRSREMVSTLLQKP